MFACAMFTEPLETCKEMVWKWYPLRASWPYTITVINVATRGFQSESLGESQALVTAGSSEQINVLASVSNAILEQVENGFKMLHVQ